MTRGVTESARGCVCMVADWQGILAGVYIYQG